MIKKLKEHIMKNHLAFSLLVFVSFFFLFQHYSQLAWDFAAYVLNAKALFYGGNYFELYRAPLVPVFLAVFLIFGTLGEYLFVLFVSILFYYSCFKLSGVIYDRFFQKRKVSFELLFFVFYLLTLNSIVFSFGTLVGTELLSLSFFILFLSFYFRNKVSGHWLALAFLTRYNFMLFIPLVFIRRDVRLILKDVGIFAVFCIPWFIWNFVNYGNWFASIIDSYSLNVYSRHDMIQPFNWFNVLKLIGWQLPAFVIGLVYSLFIFLKKNSKRFSKVIMIFLLIFLLILFDTYNVPFKVYRYLFNLVLPVAFFSLLGVMLIMTKWRNLKKIIVIVLLVVFVSIFTANLQMTYERLDYRELYPETAAKVENLGLENCRVLTTLWVPLNYYSGNIYPLMTPIGEGLEQNNMVLIFKGITTMDDLFTEDNLRNNTVFFEDDVIIIFGYRETCLEKHEMFDEPNTLEFCRVLSTKFRSFDSFVENFCDMVNFK